MLNCKTKLQEFIVNNYPIYNFTLMTLAKLLRLVCTSEVQIKSSCFP